MTPPGRVGWVDASGGLAGDMLLGALLGAGAPLAAVRDALDRLDLAERVDVRTEATVRGGLAATRAVVEVAPSHRRRTLADVLPLLDRLPAAVGGTASEVFGALAAAEATVHGVAVDEVHFHEVGALDSIVDVVGVVAAWRALDLDRLTCSPVALGGGRVDTQHGPIPVPGPAVLELLRAHDAPSYGGPVDIELATPTGVALAVVLADEFGPMPPLRPAHIGVGAGASDPPGHADVTRVVVGEGSATGHGSAPGPVESAVVIEANVDDLDPRLWPTTLGDLLAAGASDAWLTPIVMKKGRPAHTISVLCPPELADRLARVVLTRTTTIGLRTTATTKTVLPREVHTVEVHGGRVRVKVSSLDGVPLTATPEYDDVVALAEAAGLPVRTVLDAADAAAGRLVGGPEVH